MSLWHRFKRMISGATVECQASELLALVREAYSSAATKPRGRHPFPVGKAFAQEVGYPQALLDGLPPEASNSFAGVSNVGVFATIPAGATVLDLGCGSGLDSLAAAQKTGRSGRVIGLDFSKAMLDKAVAAARQASLHIAHFCCADATCLPLATGTIDVVMANGIFNLNPHRAALFGEMARVLRPGGRVFAAELIFTRPQLPHTIGHPNEWLS